MNHLSPAVTRPEATDACLVFELCALIDATAKLDEKPRDRLQAVQEVVAVAYRVAEAAEPILDNEAALLTALREAATARPPIPESCPGCQKMDGGRCGHHAGSTDVAETYHELGHALSGPAYGPSRPDGLAPTAAADRPSR
ncbi:hypothetical protein [Actinomadura bangladeshensis]|uniref:Uncharacterized protein n=1 Tax=Actinomadura bangladeshensis TaxID=453573 RepID=A0A4R4NAT6_9ACTN|nr:hypothetical protein [Actinomadura bangladeshensis]TDC06131.1 hypothetical protein E1284_34335 [Actinomadura bangladeshensis]